jgi:hypothetical protein
MSDWSVISAKPNGPTSIPIIRKLTTLGNLNRWPMYRRAMTRTTTQTRAIMRSMKNT